MILPAYPEARRVLDYEGLQLRPFYRGLEVYYKGRFHRLADPLRHPIEALSHIRDDFVHWRDRWLMLVLRKEVLNLRAINRDIGDIETEDFLRAFGFSKNIIERFFRPFFGGIFMEKDLRSSARMFLFLFSMFDKAGGAIPAHGMQAIPEQLAVALPPGSLRLNCPVQSIAAGELTLQSGELIKADHIVVATSETAAARLLPGHSSSRLLPERSTTCLYFSTDQPLKGSPVIYVDGECRGPVNWACILSRVSPAYAPVGQHLIATSIIGAPSSQQLEDVVREQMATWFGAGALEWRHLRSYQIRHAVPEGRQLSLGDGSLPAQIAPGLYRCGDYCEDVSINGALLSGRHAAEAVLAAISSSARR